MGADAFSDAVGAVIKHAKEIFSLKPCIVITTISGVLFFFPTGSKNFFSIPDGIAQYRWIAGLVWLVWGISLVLQVCSYIGRYRAKNKKEAQDQRVIDERICDMQQSIQNLPDELLIIFAQYYNYIRRTWTIDFPYNDPRLRQMTNREIVYRPSMELIFRNWTEYRAYRVCPLIQKHVSNEYVFNLLQQRHLVDIAAVFEC